MDVYRKYTVKNGIAWSLLLLSRLLRSILHINTEMYYILNER